MLKTLDDINGEPTKVTLHGPLGDMFGREHSLYISSPGEAIRALCAIKEGFRGELSRPGAMYSVLAGGDALPLEGINICTAGRDIHIVPVVEGAKSDAANALTAIAGVALLVVASVYLGPLAVGAAKGSAAAFGWGIAHTAALTLGSQLLRMGVTSLLAASDTGGKPSERPENDPSRLFNGAVNTTAQGHPIQICYGEVEIGSAIISTMIDYTYKSHSASGGGGGGGHPRYIERVIEHVDDDPGNKQRVM
jgi:predicted phage tail protein